MKFELKLIPLSVDQAEIYGTLEGVRTLRKIENGSITEYVVVDGKHIAFTEFESLTILTADNKTAGLDLTGIQNVNGRVRIYVDGMSKADAKTLKNGSVPRLFVGKKPAAKKSAKKETNDG